MRQCILKNAVCMIPRRQRWIAIYVNSKSVLYVAEWIHTALDSFAGVSAFTISKRISICPATTPTISLPPTNSFSSHVIQESPSTISKDAAIDCTLADWPLFGCSVLA